MNISEKHPLSVQIPRCSLGRVVFDQAAKRREMMREKPPLNVQVARCQLALLMFDRAMSCFTPDFFQEDRQTQQKLSRIRHWQASVSGVLDRPIPNFSRYARDKKLRQFEGRYQPQNLTKEQTAYARIALVWCAVHFLCDAWVTCPDVAKGRPWVWLCQTATSFVTALEAIFEGAWETGTKWFEDLANS